MWTGSAHNGIARLVSPIQCVEEAAREESLYRFAAPRWRCLRCLRLDHRQATLPPGKRRIGTRFRHDWRASRASGIGQVLHIATREDISPPTVPNTCPCSGPPLAPQIYSTRSLLLASSVRLSWRSSHARTFNDCTVVCYSISLIHFSHALLPLLDNLRAEKKLLLTYEPLNGSSFQSRSYQPEIPA